MSDHGHYGKRRKDESRQGTYVFTPSGKFLASINDLDPDNVLATLQRGLKKWNELSEEEKRAAPDKPLEPKHRWEQFYPRDGLVLDGYSRDLPNDGNPTSEQLPTWNRDAAWFSKSEAATMVPKEMEVGMEFDFLPAFVARMAKLHFVDNVKGQTEPFSQIDGSKISGVVSGLDGDRATIRISGVSSGQVASQRRGRGVKTKIMGSAIYDLKSRSFVEFEIVAIGERWGRTRFNDRRRQMEATPVGYVFQMAPTDAPAAIPGIIWAYDAPWLKGPE